MSTKTAAEKTVAKKTGRKGPSQGDRMIHPANPHGGTLAAVAATGSGSVNAGQKIRGIDGQVYYGVGTGIEAIFANIKNFEITITAENIEASDRSTGTWGDNMTGRLNWTADLTANLIQNGVDYTNFYNALVGATSLVFSFRPQDITAGLAHTGTGTLGNVKFSSPENGIASFTAQVRGRGALALGVVATGGTA